MNCKTFKMSNRKVLKGTEGLINRKQERDNNPLSHMRYIFKGLLPQADGQQHYAKRTQWMILYSGLAPSVFIRPLYGQYRRQFETKKGRKRSGLSLTSTNCMTSLAEYGIYMYHNIRSFIEVWHIWSTLGKCPSMPTVNDKSQFVERRFNNLWL